MIGDDNAGMHHESLLEMIRNGYGDDSEIFTWNGSVGDIGTPDSPDIWKSTQSADIW